MHTQFDVSYSEVFNIVAALGAQQCNFDALQERTASKFECSYFELNTTNAALAFRIIEGFTADSIDESWAKRDKEALIRAYALGYRQQAERIERR